MPLYSRCPQCGKAYAAGDELAGQEVRCRKCGTTFSLPQQDNSAQGFPPAPENVDRALMEATSPQNEDVDEAAQTRGGEPAEGGEPKVEKFESGMSGGVGSAKSRMQRRDDVDEYQVGGTPAAAGAGENPLLDFPFAADLDRLLPRIVLALMLLWALYQGYNWPHSAGAEQAANPAWTGAITAGWLLLMFVAVWLPIVYAGGKSGMKSVRLRIPYRRTMRMAAIASLPFGVASAFWFSGEAVASLVVGLILGCIPAGGLAFFLLRPTPRQLSSVLTPVLVSVAAAAALSAGLTVGASAILGTTMRTYRAQGTFAASPLGPGLAWPEIEAAPAPGSPKVIAPVKPAPPVTPSVASTRQASGLVRQQISLASAGSFDRAIFPRPVGEFVAVQRRAKDDIDVEVQSIAAGRATAAVSFPVEVNTTAALSSDGRMLARLSSFPRLSVQIWSFVESRVIRSFDIGREGDVQLVGFTAAGQVVLQSSHQRRQSGSATVLEGLQVEMLDVVSGARYTPVKLEGTFSPRTAYSADLSQVAYIQAGANVKLIVASLLPAGALIQVESGTTIDLSKVDPAFAAQPSAMTFSPDGSQIAVAFERDRQVGLMIWRTRGEGTAVEYVYPRTLELPEAEALSPRRPMVWLAQPAVCVYGGTAVLDPATGARLGSLGLSDVREMVAAGADRIIVEVGAAGEAATLLLVDLDIKRQGPGRN